MMPAKVPAEVTRKAFSGRVRCFLESWLVEAREWKWGGLYAVDGYEGGILT